MPWTEDRYPPSMARLPPRVRSKAIEIANAVLARDADEGKAIRIGIARARQWALARPAAGFAPVATRRLPRAVSAWTERDW